MSITWTTKRVHGLRYGWPDLEWSVGDDEITVYNGELPSMEEIDAKGEEAITIMNLRDLRAVRNSKLEETDWWELPSQLPMSEARAEYRQALRDITDNYTSLEDVIWPEKPE
jgi:hypothetical protein